MVVLIPHLGLVPGRSATGLDTTDEVLLDEDPERVVHGLTGDRPDLVAHRVGQLFGGRMRVAIDGFHHGDPLSGHLKPMVAELLRDVGSGRIGHGSIKAQILDLVRSWTVIFF